METKVQMARLEVDRSEKSTRRTSRIMRVHFGDLPQAGSGSHLADGWVRVTGPASRSAHLLTWLLGVALFFFLITSVIAVSVLAGPSATSQSVHEFDTPWLAIGLTLLLSVLAHELAHAAFLPDHGLSPSTVFVLWPRKLRFGIFYEGSMSRSRWLVMRSAPILVLGVLPTLWLIVTTGHPRNFVFETVVTIILLINSLGSGADLVAIHWVATRIPKGSTLRFQGGKAYWKAADHRLLD